MAEKRRKYIPHRHWPADDQAAWQRAIREGSLLDDRGTAAHWSQASRSAAQQGYGRWLAHLRDHEPLEAGQSGMARLEPSRVTVFLAHLEATVAPVTVANEIQRLWSAVRVMAPDRDWHWLKGLARQVSRWSALQASPSKPAADSRDLLQLGIRLMEKAKSAPEIGSLRKQAVTFRDGLMIALLACRPVRRRTLASICIGQQLQRIGNVWWLIFTAADIKTRRPLEYRWPEILTPFLDDYVGSYRLLFPRPDSTDALWLSTHGGRLTAQAIYDRVRARTAVAFGTAVTPHQFRHAAATTFSRLDPEHVMAVAPLLGHAKLDTACSHYIRSDTREAARQHQGLLQARRRGLHTNRRYR